MVSVDVKNQVYLLNCIYLPPPPPAQEQQKRAWLILMHDAVHLQAAREEMYDRPALLHELRERQTEKQTDRQTENL